MSNETSGSPRRAAFMGGTAHAPDHGDRLGLPPSMRMTRRTFTSLTLALAGAPLAWATQSTARHGIAMHGAPALPPGFTHLPYVNPDAPKGGRAVLGHLGSFDSLRPFIVRGQQPPYLREFVFESLLGRSLDEPFSLYGLIAREIEVPRDRSTITFHLNPRARFADGAPVTAEDVRFSWSLLKDKGLPFMRAHYRTAVEAMVLSPLTIRFVFDASGNREAPLLLGLMPILPRHAIDAETFEQTSLEPPLGSGPYRIAGLEPGRSIAYERRADWWGASLPINRGRYNINDFRVEFFRDVTSLYEAFKAGQVHLRPEDDPSRWMDGYRFPAVQDGRVKVVEIDIAIPAGMSALAMNTRRWPFDDQRVRAALIHMFDFEWINRNLYHGAYTRTESFFARSALASTGRPADARERALLAPFPGAVKPEILAGTYRFPWSDGSGHNRDNLARAVTLLAEAGFTLANGQMRHRDGRLLAFEILATTRVQERLLLAFASTLTRLGIRARVRLVDSSQYQERLRTFDFDMIQALWPASLSPGNEQINRWGSASADIPRSLNFPGVRNPAVDAMIEAMLKAEEREDFEAAVRALDRVLLSGDYVIPLFHVRKQWIAHWSHLVPPARHSLHGVALDTWWAVSDTPAERKT